MLHSIPYFFKEIKWLLRPLFAIMGIDCPGRGPLAGRHKGDPPPAFLRTGPAARAGAGSKPGGPARAGACRRVRAGGGLETAGRSAGRRLRPRGAGGPQSGPCSSARKAENSPPPFFIPLSTLRALNVEALGRGRLAAVFSGSALRSDPPPGPAGQTAFYCSAAQNRRRGPRFPPVSAARDKGARPGRDRAAEGASARSAQSMARKPRHRPLRRGAVARPRSSRPQGGIRPQSFFAGRFLSPSEPSAGPGPSAVPPRRAARLFAGRLSLRFFPGRAFFICPVRHHFSPWAGRSGPARARHP